MRYLKHFNESYVTTNELKEFCEWNLATLLDNGYKFQVEYDGWDDDNDNFYIDIDSNKFGTFFSWDDVKDYVIPFMFVLKEKYDLDWGGYDIKLVLGIINNARQTHEIELYSRFFKLEDLEDLKADKINSLVIKVSDKR